ncbi:MAG: DUF2284 domain-containing protein [Firmicutes bacterium]|nr:DUF2284 domain-containing protein [Bacillota bacterium]
MKIETYEKTIAVSDYIEGYVCVEEFLEMCKACRNWQRKWSCPSYDFDPVEDYWKKYEQFHVVGKKMILEEEEKENWQELMAVVKEELTTELFEREAEHEGSQSLSAGSCQVCGEDNCTRKIGEPCRFPDKMRYSIESLGGNVGLTCSKLLGIRLQWIEEGKIPDYFVLVGGLLY